MVLELGNAAASVSVAVFAVPGCWEDMLQELWLQSPFALQTSLGLSG